MHILSHLQKVKALGRSSHAEGVRNNAIGYGSHVEGNGNEATGHFSHVGGVNNTATGKGAFVHGTRLQMNQEYGAAFGRYNEGKYPFEIGMGASDTNRKSVLALNHNGDLLIYRPGEKNADGTWKRKPRRYSLSSLLNAIGAFDKVDGWGGYTEFDF